MRHEAFRFSMGPEEIFVGKGVHKWEAFVIVFPKSVAQDRSSIYLFSGTGSCNFFTKEHVTIAAH